MADEIYTFRTIRIVDLPRNPAVNIIADQEEDVLTLEAGANVQLTVVEDRVIISTESPIGFTGSRGYTGSIGFTGSRGFQGSIGIQGTRGFDGSIGVTGNVGFTGSQGIQGNVGPQGNVGFTGSKGERSVVPGYTGSQGNVGLIGFTGSQGIQGERGFTGSLGNVGPLGYTGSRGFIGYTGSQGGAGFTGSVGFTGSIGYTGSRGRTGYSGSRGYTGSKGDQGIQGISGLRGFTGSRGVQGQLGQTGYTGSRGFVGSTGYTGSRGPRGFTGSQGEPADAFRTFRTQNSDGSTSVIIADQPEDVLTFVAAKGITIDFNEATDTITFAGTGEGGGGGNANVIPALTVVNNQPDKDSYIAYNATTGVLEYTPYDISGLATSISVEQALQESKDYTNTSVSAEAQLRADADSSLETYVNTEIARLESELGSNVITINDAIDEANVYLQGLIDQEAMIRANADINLQNQINTLSGNTGNILVDLDSNVTALEQQIQQVALDSILRDADLQTEIDGVSDGLAQEVLDRIAGDNALEQDLTANISMVNGRIDIVAQDLADETNARLVTDVITTLKIQKNTNDISNVANALAQETLDRIAGDDHLQNQIYDQGANDAIVANNLAQEIQDRIDGDQQLQDDLSNAVILLNSEIEVVSNAVVTEAQIRANADLQLNALIDIEADRNDVQDTDIDELEVRVHELENRVQLTIDYEADLTQLGNPNTSSPGVGEFIPMTGLPGAITGFTLDGPGSYAGGGCYDDGFIAVRETGSGTGAEWQIKYIEDNGQALITSVELLNPGTGYQAGDRFRIQGVPGICFGPVGYAIIEIDSVTTNTVTDQWADTTVLYMNTRDDTGTFHFLNAMTKGDDLVFQHSTLDSVCRFVVAANVELNSSNTSANVMVTATSYRGVIEPSDGDANTHNDDYNITFFPALASDVPSYNYVDMQDERRVLKTGDTMTGTLHMDGGDVVVYGNAGSAVKLVGGAQLSVDNGGYIRVSEDSEIQTYNINSPAYLSLQQMGREVMRFSQDESESSQKIVYPVAYTGYTIDPEALVPKKYVDTAITQLDLEDTYVNRDGDTMFGQLAWDDNIVNTIKIAPVEGSLAKINYFNDVSILGQQTTLIDMHLRGNSDNNRYRILGGDSAANTMVTYTSSGNVIYSTDVSLSGHKISDLGNPDVATDAANKGYVDSAITKSQEDIADEYVNVDGDTMTGKLTITSGGLRISNAQDITVEGGDIIANNDGSVVTNHIKTPDNDPLTFGIQEQVRLALGTDRITANEPIVYDSITLSEPFQASQLIPKSYVDDAFIKRNDETDITSTTTVKLDPNSNPAFRVQGHSGISFEIKTENNTTLFYSRGSDIRIANNDANNDNSVLNRSQNDERYGLKGDFLAKSGGTMTGKLTTADLEVTGAFKVNNTQNSLNFIADKYGVIKHKSTSKIQLGSEVVIVEGRLKVQDGLDSNTGLPVDGQIDMNDRKIVNLLNPTDPQDAATKNYVDEKVAQGGGGSAEGAVLLTGDNLTETNWKIKNAANSKTFLDNTGNEIGIYNVKSPTASNHAMPRSYADGRYLMRDTNNTFSLTTTFKANSNAKFYVQNSVNNSSNFFKVLSYSGSELFGVDGDGMVRVPRTPSSDSHVANKKYVDDKVSSSSGGVEVYGSSSPPSTMDRGTLLMTSTNNLYIYV